MTKHHFTPSPPGTVPCQGDLNASPEASGTPSKWYPPLAYNAVKGHPLGLRSVLNDDFAKTASRKAFYRSTEDPRGRVSSPLTEVDLMGLRNDDAASDDSSKGNYFAWGFNQAKRDDSSGAGGNVDGSSINTAAAAAAAADSEVWTSWKSRRKQGVEKVVKNCIDYILYSPPAAVDGGSGGALPSVGVRALGALDLLSEEEVGPGFLPSPSYPSDHIAIAADVEVVVLCKP